MIHLLDTETINKIAAGEVIERPASVVKELTENAIDAGADRIKVEIEDGGISFIRVSDNGSGIPKGDIKNAFVKHATSKISSVDDITGVQTLGFRGEALSSIAAVAKVSLLTKTKGSVVGYSYQITAGEEESFEEAGLPEGTVIIVRDLFFNTPVRKKFLKSATAEAAMVATLMEHMALSCPDISFSFVNNGKEKLSTTGNGDLKEVIYSLYGRDITGNVIEVNEENEDVKIRGFIGKPAISRGNRSFENYAINARYIKNDSISAAIEEAYKGYIMLHNFPFTALLFEIDPSLLDVNVHPAKRELRLTASESVCAFITEALRKRISGTDIVPEVTPDHAGPAPDKTVPVIQEGEEDTSTVSWERGEVFPDAAPENDGVTASVTQGSGEVSPAVTPDNDGVTASVSQESGEVSSAVIRESDGDTASVTQEGGKASSAVIRESDGVTASVIPESEEVATMPTSGAPTRRTTFLQQEIPGVRAVNRYRLIGQLFATYWLIEADDTFYMMDQHAAHEKILYERLMKSVTSKAPRTQYLTVPVIIDCTAESLDLLNTDSRLYASFTELGYELEPFGDKSLKITGVPAGLPKMDHRQMLTDMTDLLAEKKESGIKPSDTPQIMIEKIASMSCKAAIKGNDRISETEALALISEMMEAENPFNCPHGRPTLIAMTKYEIEKKFKRIV